MASPIKCFEELLAVRAIIKRKVTRDREYSESKLKAQWDTVNALVSETSALNDQVSLVANEEARAAAAGIERHMRDLKRELDRANTKNTTPKGDDDYREGYMPVRNRFLAAATKEIGIGGTPRSRTWLPVDGLFVGRGRRSWRIRLSMDQGDCAPGEEDVVKAQS